jgi:hypothetical protein
MSLQRTNRDQKRARRHRAQRDSVPRLPKFEFRATHGAGPAATGTRVGFPANRTVDLDYSTMVLCNSAISSNGLYQFRLNSAFDPDYTSVGHQPMGFDQWSQFYNHYVVEHTSYEISINTAPNGGTCVRTFVHLSDDPTVPYTDLHDLVELGAQYGVLHPVQGPHIFSGKVNIAKFFNRENIASDPELRAGVGSNPTDNVILSVITASQDGSTSATNYLDIKLRMRVRFMEPKDLTPSKTSAGYVVVSGVRYPVAASPPSVLQPAPTTRL